MNGPGRRVWVPLLIELVLYAALVSVYTLVVLHGIGDWLAGLSRHHRVLYAVASVGLVCVQAVALDAVTAVLGRLLLRGRRRA